MFSSNSSQVSSAANYIEDVFSTYLYTGTGAARTIVNNIDLATYGGLIWIKDRTTVTNHCLVDTVQGITKNLVSNTTAAAATVASGDDITSFTTTGWTFGLNNLNINNNGDNFVSWTFRKQPKFFDIVTYTGDAVNGRAIAHNLGSVPGCIIVKTLSNTSDWLVYHRSLSSPTTKALYLNATNAEVSGAYFPTTPTSTVFYTNGGGYDVNDSGRTYVAYLFAHDAGGFGLAGTDNVISCGTFTTDAGGTASVTLGYEPQWVMIKRTDSVGPWVIQDIMRGMSNTYGAYLYANTANAEVATNGLIPNATGFTAIGNTTAVSATYIYIAIRRGPMKVPTLGTSVFEPVAYSGDGTNNRIISSSITPDSVIPAYRNTTGAKYWYDRLRGNGTYLITSGTNAEGNDGAVYGPQFNKVQTGYQQGTSDSGFLNNGSYTYVNWLFKRAPGFFDEVCYTGTGVARTVTHNLTVAPEMIITKNRSGPSDNWLVFTQPTGNSGVLVLQNTDALYTPYFDWVPTSTTFSVAAQSFSVNDSGVNYVAYLFATCPGVSKVGSYTGTATTLQIDCGFTGGARFVLIKRTDSTGAWYVWDSARGIIAGNDPYLLLNSTAAEVTNTDYVDTYSAGFEVTSTAPAALNATGGTYIFLAIA